MTPMIEELAAEPRLLFRHTVEDYHRMLASGTIEEGAPFELLDGQIVHKIRSASGQDIMTVGTHHATVVMRLSDLNTNLKRSGCYIRLQGPITLPPNDEPEPDGAIVRGTDVDYLEHHPTAADVICVIEVADASLRRDRGYKQKLYADNNIGTYIIVNLLDRVVEVYSQPLKGAGRYGQVATLTTKQSVSFPTAGKKALSIAVRTLLP